MSITGKVFIISLGIFDLVIASVNGILNLGSIFIADKIFHSTLPTPMPLSDR